MFLNKLPKQVKVFFKQKPLLWLVLIIIISQLIISGGLFYWFNKEINVVEDNQDKIESSLNNLSNTTRGMLSQVLSQLRRASYIR